MAADTHVDNGESLAPTNELRNQPQLPRFVELDDSTVDADVSAQLLQRTTREKDVDGFVCGSVKRVKLHNFMTYDRCEFILDPGLNMIIGPNGTGKSTFVCALAIGLAYNPSVTGRGGELWPYIRNGQEHAEVVISLSRGRHPDGDLVLRRTLHRDVKKSEFFMDDKAVGLRDVRAVLDNLNIQIDNICQFLPQDRVSALAAMNSIDLLKEVEKAAGPPRMFQDHMDIIELSQQCTQSSASIEYLTQELHTLTNKNASIEADYERLQKRNLIQRDLQISTIFLLQEQYEQYRTQHQTVKNDIKENEKQAARIDAALRSWRDEARKLQDSVAQAEEKRKIIDEQHRESHVRMQRIMDEVEKMAGDAEYEHREIANIKKKMSVNERKICDLKVIIQSLQAEVANEPQRNQHVLDEVNEEIARVQERMRAQHNHMSEIKLEKEKVDYEIAQTQHELSGVEKRLENARNIAVQQGQNLARLDREAYDVWQWIKQHPNSFSMQVFDPLMFSIRVREPKYTQIVENCLPPQLWMQTFLVQCEGDFEVLVRQFIDNPDKAQKRRIGVRELKVASSATPRKIPKDALRELGFDGYVSELLDGHPDLIEYLSREFNLANFPYAFGDVDHKTIVEQRLFSSYIAQNQSYRIRYYGDAFANNSQMLRPVRLLGTQVNQEDVDTQEELKSKLRSSLDTYQNSLKQAMIALQKERTVHEKLGEQKNEAMSRKQQLLQQYNEYERSKVKLQNAKNELNEAEEYPSKAEEQIQQINRRFRRSVEKRAKSAASLLDIVEGVQQLLLIRQLTHVKLVQTKVDLQRHQQSKDDYEEEMERFRTQIARLHGERNQIKDSAMVAQAKWQRAIQLAMEELEKSAEAITEEIKQLKATDDLNDLDREDLIFKLQSMVDDYQVQLEACRHASNGVVEEYERRLKQIEEKRKDLAQHQASHDVVKTNVETIRNKWLPQLKSLATTVSSEFSEYFRKIGCAGEVELKEDTDYSKFALQIRVKFRADGELQVLEKSRQSGGERAVSTILFLLSLQQFSKSPFRLVDEINQGMDARNERMIHRRLVESASEEHSPQYFLITPKLLTHLHYAHKRMRVHCVFNGEYVDGALVQPSLSIGKYLESRQKKQRRIEVQ